MPLELTSVGTIEAVRSAAVGSQVGGVVTHVSFREGDPVRAGQILFQLDPRPFHAALDQAQATLARDQAQAEAAKSEADRAQSLYEDKVLSQAEWDQTRSTAAALAATVRADMAAVANAKLNLEYASIRAPFSGRAGRRMVDVGDYIRAATTDPLVTVLQPNPARVRFTIPERDVPLVQRYLPSKPRVVVEAGAFSREGTLVFVDNAVDPSSGTLLLKGELPNADGRLVPGQFVTTRLVLTVAPRALVIPTDAVSQGQEGPFVYVVAADSTVSQRPIQVERTAGEWTVVAGGLRPGDPVVTEGQMRLAPGARVLIRNGGPSEASR